MLGGTAISLAPALLLQRGGDLFRPPVVPRPRHHLADRLRVGAAPRLPGVYDPGMLEPGDVLGKLGEQGPETAVFVSHARIDHCGLVGTLRPGTAVDASPDAAALMRALAASGDGLPGREPDWRPPADETPHETPLAVGPLTVERVTVDHEVPGAGGYLVTTSDGYSRDLERVREFGDAAGPRVARSRGAAPWPFESRWALFVEWLEVLGIPLRRIGFFGHATADDPHTLVHRAGPRTVVPIHTDAPERLHPVGGPRRTPAAAPRAGACL